MSKEERFTAFVNATFFQDKMILAADEDVKAHPHNDSAIKIRVLLKGQVALFNYIHDISESLHDRLDAIEKKIGEK